MNTYVRKAVDAATLRTSPVWRSAFGLAIALAGCLLLAARAFEQLAAGSPAMRAALIGGGVAAAATALGTLPVLLARRVDQRSYDGFLGFGAGVMLGATAFSLIVPALAAARSGGTGAIQASLLVGAAILAGAMLVLLLDRATARFCALPGPDYQARKGAWLFVAAVTLHNLPEGLAMGVAYAGADLERAHSLATGIALQDVPEGLVVALALRSVGYGRWRSAAMGMLSGLVEPVAAAFGVALISMSQDLLAPGLAVAAGAMLLVIVHDVIPASQRGGNNALASAALVLGFTLMTILDTALA